ncbi:MAG: hypothetical protein AAFY34_11740 [Pseudomonadota bacterium]
MKRITLLASISLGVVVFAVPTASASYMETCKALISDWQTCQETGGACSAETAVIEEKCRCHSFQQGAWKLVNAAVAKDDVCDQSEWPPVPPPTPTPPEVRDPSPPPPGHDVPLEQERRNRN